jgi:hypothetical protein
VPKITDEVPFGGAVEKITRLGLASLHEEIRVILTGFQLLVLEERDANGGAAVRKMIDAEFEARVGTGWKKAQTGAVDWTKCKVIDGTSLCIGVEIQVSARSDLLIIDLVHLRRDLTGGLIDVGFLVVPNDRLGPFLTDRGPRLADARRMVREARVEDLPIILVGIEHDGPGPFLAKQSKAPRPSGTRPRPSNFN